tara:strand:- start:22594 stop:23451 length:858 start_codon:yes stop_codon:yes gene_type:complete
MIINRYFSRIFLSTNFLKIIYKFFAKKFIKLNIFFHYQKIKKISLKKKINKKLIDKIYICHHSPLRHRKLRLKKIVDKFKTKLEWVEGFSPYDIKIDYKKKLAFEKNKIDKSLPGIDQYQYTYYKNAGREITISEYSLFLKMKYCFEDQIKNQRKIIIIFEDDVILSNEIENYLNICSFEFKNHIPKLDCLMIGTAFKFKSKFYNPKKVIHFGKNQLTRCTHAMMFSLNAAEKIYKNLNRVNWPIDYKLNEIIIKESLNVAWSEPGLLQSSLFMESFSSIIKNYN